MGGTGVPSRPFFCLLLSKGTAYNRITCQVACLSIILSWMAQVPIPTDIKTPQGNIYLHAFDSGDLLVSYYRRSAIAGEFSDIMGGRARYHEKYSNENIAKWVIPQRYADDIVRELMAL